MQPISHHYHQRQIGGLLTAFTALPFLMQLPTAEIYIAKGQPILQDKRMEMIENSLRNNAKVIITEHGISLTLLLGNLSVSVSPSEIEAK